VWYPTRSGQDERADRWLANSYERFCALAEEPETGIILRGGIELFRTPADDAWWRDALPGFRRARASELPSGFADGFVAEGIPVIEMPVYMAWLSRRVEHRGGSIVERTLSSFDEAFAAADVVVDCAGFGARALAGDEALVPVRGHVVRVEQVGLDRYVSDEQGPRGVTYIYPRSRDIVLGGTRQVGQKEAVFGDDVERDIVARCVAIEPRLEGARVLSRAVGIRPGRPSVRLEAERHGSGGLLVHDYGHGGSGVTLSWGCAEDVVALISEGSRLAPRVD
jgi:D-amino-acid oxidase